MAMRLKILIIMGFVFFISCMITWVATVTLVQSEYINLEANNTKNNTSRGVNALENKIDQLAQKSPDWSSWDDTYKFIEDHNKAYIVSNIQGEGLKNLDINFMLFYDQNQKLVQSASASTETGEPIPVPEELTKAFTENDDLLSKKEDDQHSGLLKTSTDPLIISASPILHSDGSGPVKGTLVFARYLTSEDITKLGELTKLNLRFDSATDANGQPTIGVANINDNSTRTRTDGSKSITGYQIINDVYGKPLLVAKVEQPRSIFQETQRTLIFYILIVMGVSLIAIIVVMYTTGRIMRQNRDIETEKANKKEIEKQVVDRTREANDEQARLRSAIDSMESGMLITFKDRNLITYNPSLLNILGLRGEAISTKRSETNITFDQVKQKLIQVEGIDLVTMINQSQNNGKTFRIKEATYNNRVLSVFITPVIVHLDKIIGSVLLIEDITEQKVHERSKDEFFSIASHELRTPLTAIKGNSSMILDFYKDVLKDDQLKEMILDVHESSVRLIDIVNDFLDVSRLEQGKVKFSYGAVNLEEIIEKVAYEMKAELANGNLKLDLDKHTLGVLPKVWADDNRLKQVIYNIVGNAAKFTTKGTISISAVADKDFVKVQVTDTGRGMSPEAQRLLFHKFQQAGDSLLTRDTTRGTGLGLYISKMIIENMGGSIALEKSAEGIGSTFSFTVPVANKSKTKSKPKQEITNSSTGITDSDAQ